MRQEPAGAAVTTAVLGRGWVEKDTDAEPQPLTSPLVSPGTDLGRPIRIAVISNPRSGNNKRGNRLETIRSALDAAGVSHLDARTPDRIAADARELVRAGTELIVVNGGDGTVQAVLTGVLRVADLHRPPLLVVLPGGSTNTTARNVGYGESATDGLRDLVAEASRGRLTGRLDEHRVVRVDRGAESAPLFAMCFGAGAVYHGIRFFKEQVETRGMRGQFGAAVALAVFVGKIATGEGAKLFPPLEVSVAVDGQSRQSESLRGMLVSTMERQFLGIRPYWGEGVGALLCSELAYAPRHLARAVIPVLRGKPNRFVRPEYGYRSYNAQQVELRLNSGFILDGELFTPEPDALVRLSAERSAFFLRRCPE